MYFNLAWFLFFGGYFCLVLFFFFNTATLQRKVTIVCLT